MIEWVSLAATAFHPLKSSEIVSLIGSEILPVQFEDELRQSFLDYAMSVIVGRALPDVRDGLKPVHRRVLYAMHEMRNTHNRPYVKSARVVGEVIGKYHPHGESAVYDTMVRMAQDFSMRYLLVEGQGNFGSVDGDPPAAMRYTEVRMRRITAELLADIDMETVPFVDNYDGTLQMPEALPTRVPNLLVNGSDGIAVGMATKIPPHNLNEVIDASLALLADPDIDLDALMAHVKGPDFPTAGLINGRAGIVSAYATGRGRIYLRGSARIEGDPFEDEEEDAGRDFDQDDDQASQAYSEPDPEESHVRAARMDLPNPRIVLTEFPYQVNKARWIEKVAELVKEKKIEGITEIRDESDKDGLRVVVEVRRGQQARVVLNSLYAMTQFQSVYAINLVALVDGRPRLLTLKEALQAFLKHRRDVITRRTAYLLRAARARGHTLEGQAVALTNVDEVVELIRSSQSRDEARDRLMERAWPLDSSMTELIERAGRDACRPAGVPQELGLQESSEPSYRLSEEQAQSILELRLHRLTALEVKDLIAGYEKVLQEIVQHEEILASEARLTEVVRDELVEVRDTYGDARRTRIRDSQEDLLNEDLIKVEDLVVTISHGGYAKIQSPDEYQAQTRGGVGKRGMTLWEDDFIEHMLIANSHDTLLCFSNTGKVYWKKVYLLPRGPRTSRGRPLVNLLSLEEDERITAVLPVKSFDADHFVFMATQSGKVKKTPLANFSRPYASGIRAINLEEDNTLIGAAITDGSADVILFADSGKAVRFKESDVRAMGRTAAGVLGMRVRGAKVIALIIPQQDGAILTISERGYGKRSPLSDFPTKGRGSQGVIGMRVNERNGRLVGALQVFAGDEVMAISNQGTLIRTPVDEISVQSRATQGVRLMNLKGDALVAEIDRIEESSLTPECSENAGEGEDQDAAEASGQSEDDPSA